MLQAIFEQNRKIQRRLTMMVIGNYLRLALIVIPLILGAIYLPPLIADLYEQYAALLSGNLNPSI